MEMTRSVQVPEDIFHKLQNIAKFTHRTITDIIVNTINATFVSPTPLPAPISDELASMNLMKDDSLWDAINPSVTPKERQRLEVLNSVSKQRSLSSEELSEQQDLLMAHHHSVLRRAQAIAILTLRGYDISEQQLRETVI